MNNKVFVYGTLKQGWGGNSILEGAKKLGVAETRKRYSVIGSGFPRAFAEDDPNFQKELSGYLIGEAYEVSEKMMERMDYYEGHPDFFERKKVVVTLENDEKIIAWMYHSKHKPNDNYSCVPNAHERIVWPNMLKKMES